MISKLRSEDGVWIRKEEEMADVVSGFFDKLFTNSNPKETELNDILEFVEKEISEKSSELLKRPFTKEDVKRALFQIHPTKVPGLDGLSDRFFQKFWPAIVDEVTKVSLGYLNGGGDFAQLNKTLMVLIPKIEQTTDVKEFRPISLCNTTYKIISKAIVSRLKKVLHEIIDENQSAFIAGHQITNNILIGFECIHWMQNKERKATYAALKLDMSNAYNRVEWKFIEAVLEKWRFPCEFVQLIMRCITIATYYFVLNGNVYKNVVPTRDVPF